MSLLTLKNVIYKYDGGKKIVLNDVNAEFEPGVVYTIVGKSGAGKSTLLSLMSGLDLCTSGDILYKEKDIKDIDRDKYRAKDIGVVFQGFNLLTNANSVENIILSMNISGVTEKNKRTFAYKLLQNVGIDEETADRKVLRLSGGEQQRVGIARALSHNPDIIIADEPTGNLDKETEMEILKIFIDLAHKENKCVIIVTHSKKVTSVADVVLKIDEGKLIQV